jgi:hypothetical protein
MEAMNLVDLPGAVVLFGIVFWLAGGAKWLGEKTRQLKLDNDRKERELERDKQ